MQRRRWRGGRGEEEEEGGESSFLGQPQHNVSCWSTAGYGGHYLGIDGPSNWTAGALFYRIMTTTIITIVIMITMMKIIIVIKIMKSTKVQYWNIWIENTFACIRIIVLGIYRTSFQHNLHCFINACVHVVND